MNAYRLIDLPMPSADLSPQEVIRTQLYALQHNDEEDTGITTAFNFASPTNKAHTGPLERFKQLVRNPIYEQMLNFKSYRYSKIEVHNAHAQQIVIVTDHEGNDAAYLFILSKQTNAPYEDCWMTDGVMRLKLVHKKTGGEP